MSKIKPTYLSMKELGEDCLDSLEDYLKGLSVSEYDLEEIVKLVPILIDIFNLTFTEKSSQDRNPLEYRVNTDTMAIMSECFDILNKCKAQREITTPSVYGSTMRSLAKLKKVIDTLTEKAGEFNIDEDMTQEDFILIGLNKKS